MTGAAIDTQAMVITLTKIGMEVVEADATASDVKIGMFASGIIEKG